jgi:hypothetical protein
MRSNKNIIQLNTPPGFDENYHPWMKALIVILTLALI